MKILFSKYQGTGNDFIMIDNRDQSFPQELAIIQKLCHPKFGVGADGLILMEKHPTLDYRMVYYNADGSQSLCGNGSRCGFAFAQSLSIAPNPATFETTDGIHQIKRENGLIRFQLHDVKANFTHFDEDLFIDTGSPHLIRWVDKVDKVDVVQEGSRIRYQSVFERQNGTNVNFAQILNGKVVMRTYERGVENETLSCGTGATAVALAASLKGLSSPITLETQGGVLEVSFEQKEDLFTDIWLSGPAEKVFEGTIQI